MKHWCKIPVSVPYKNYNHFYGVRLWLASNFDQDQYDLTGTEHDYSGDRLIHFEHPEDAAMFALRWA